jgi:hypothetical protein
MPEPEPETLTFHSLDGDAAAAFSPNPGWWAETKQLAARAAMGRDDVRSPVRRRGGGGLPGRTVAERFWEKVDKEADAPCWMWTASKGDDGYGRLWLDGRLQPAHRIAWMLTRGPIPAGLYVLHNCGEFRPDGLDQPACVRHLYLGDASANIRDAWARNPDYRARRGAAQSGERGTNAKLTADLVREIRARYAAGESQDALALAFGVAQTTISVICRRKTWLR